MMSYNSVKMQKNKPTPSPPAPPGIHVWLIFIKAFLAINRVAMASLGDSGLCESDFRVLEVLLHKGPQPVNALGPRVHLTPGSISTAVDRLYARRLVSREEDAHDRRVRMVSLTPDGRKLIDPVFRHHAAVMEQVASVLAPRERLHLERLLKKIGRHAETLRDPDSPLVSCPPAE
jgi:MarR family 2-MHQ and catechol resistance regulon transcriptional repressor